MATRAAIKRHTAAWCAGLLPISLTESALYIAAGPVMRWIAAEARAAAGTKAGHAGLSSSLMVPDAITGAQGPRITNSKRRQRSGYRLGTTQRPAAWVS